MASRGSLDTRRAGSRSIPICGLSIAAARVCETSVDMARLQTSRQEAWSGAEGRGGEEQEKHHDDYEDGNGHNHDWGHELQVRGEERPANARREM